MTSETKSFADEIPQSITRLLPTKRTAAKYRRSIRICQSIVSRFRAGIPSTTFFGATVHAFNWKSDDDRVLGCLIAKYFHKSNEDWAQTAKAAIENCAFPM
jgi:hypothetical protein